jgi:two-component system, OmpR family, response regulator
VDQRPTHLDGHRIVRVLVVEDDAAMAASIERALTTAGFSVDVARDGPTGLWHARESAYDVITLDVMLPGMSGWDVCTQLRADGVTTPVLMLTALDDDRDEANGFAVGVDDYVRKPFSPPLLVARIHALGRRGPSLPETIEIDGVRVDPLRRQCERDGEQIALTPREYAVLEALARRAPSVVSKRELLDLVWGFDFEGDPSIVEVYVSYLRRKLDRDRERPVVHTVRGAGYRLGP